MQGLNNFVNGFVYFSFFLTRYDVQIFHVDHIISVISSSISSYKLPILVTDAFTSSDQNKNNKQKNCLVNQSSPLSIQLTCPTLNSIDMSHFSPISANAKFSFFFSTRLRLHFPERF